MPYEHIPPEYQNSAGIQAAAERAAAIEYLALQPPAQGDPAIMQLIQRDEAEQSEYRRRILGALIEQGGNAGHYNKASIMLQVAASIRPEERQILEDNTLAGAGRTIAIERGLRYFANHPETFLAELRNPNPPPALDPNQGFLSHVLTHHLYADPRDAGALGPGLLWHGQLLPVRLERPGRVARTGRSGQILQRSRRGLEPPGQPAEPRGNRRPGANPASRLAAALAGLPDLKQITNCGIRHRLSSSFDF